MISRLLFSLLLIPLVFSEPDLCRNPKLDSISYIPDKKMWFFTSAGYYWVINETEFPPGPPKDKLPDPFKKGDAAFYMDYPGLCAQIGSPSKDVRKDQMVSVVEKVGDSNKLIGLDINQMRWSKTWEWSGNKLVGRANIDNSNEQIDAIFTKGEKSDSIHNEIYVIQKQKFAAVDWKGYCQNPNSFATAYPPQEVRAFHSEGKNFDAMTTKVNQIYIFIDKEFFIFDIDFKGSNNGNIKGSKGQKKNIQKEFFKCPEIAMNGTNTDPKPPESDEPPANGAKPDKTDGNPNVGNPEDTKPEGSGGGALFLIVVIVVVLVIVVLVIGLVVWGMKGKPESEAKKDEAKPAPKAPGASQKAKPKAKGGAPPKPV